MSATSPPGAHVDPVTRCAVQLCTLRSPRCAKSPVGASAFTPPGEGNAARRVGREQLTQPTAQTACAAESPQQHGKRARREHTPLPSRRVRIRQVRERATGSPAARERGSAARAQARARRRRATRPLTARPSAANAQGVVACGAASAQPDSATLVLLVGSGSTGRPFSRFGSTPAAS